MKNLLRKTNNKFQVFFICCLIVYGVLINKLLNPLITNNADIDAEHCIPP